MAGACLEIVLMKQLASCLAVPILLVDRQLDLVFFNESAEPLLGGHFEETGGIQRAEWSSVFQATDGRGAMIAPDERPLAIAIDRRKPAHRRFGLTGLDRITRQVEAVAFPLETADNGLAGAVSIFWAPSERTPTTPPAAEACGRAALSRHDVEVILLRRLAARLRTPILMVGPDGRIVYCNEAAEPLLGSPLARIDGMPLPEWYDAFQPTDEDGSPIRQEDHPLNVARTRLHPCHRRFFYRALDGAKRGIAGTAFPLLGQCNRQLGAVGIFWEDAP